MSALDGASDPLAKPETNIKPDLKPGRSINSDLSFLNEDVSSRKASYAADANPDSIKISAPDSTGGALSTVSAGIQPQGIRSRWAGDKPVVVEEKPVESKDRSRIQRKVFFITLLILAPMLAVMSAVLADRRFAHVFQDPKAEAVLVKIVGKNFQNASLFWPAQFFFEQAYRLDPSDTTYLVDAALMKNLSGDIEGAKKDYLESIRIKPSARAWNNLGTIYENQDGHPEQAIKAFNEALRLDPKWVLSWCNRGDIRFDQKKYDLALRDFSTAVKIGYARAYFYRVKTYKAMGQTAKAARDEAIIKRHGYTDTLFCFMPPPPPEEQ